MPSSHMEKYCWNAKMNSIPIPPIAGEEALDFPEAVIDDASTAEVESPQEALSFRQLLGRLAAQHQELQARCEHLEGELRCCSPTRASEASRPSAWRARAPVTCKLNEDDPKLMSQASEAFESDTLCRMTSEGILSTYTTKTQQRSRMNVASDGSWVRTWSERKLRSQACDFSAMRKQFLRLNPRSDGSLEVSDFEQKLRAMNEQTQGAPIPAEPPLASIVQELNEACGRADLGERITFETFADIMNFGEDDEMAALVLDDRAAGKTKAVRAVLVRDEMQKAVARLSNVRTQDLSRVPSSGGNFAKRRAALKTLLDPIALVAIMSNAILLGVREDVDPEWTGWTSIEYGFSAFFTFELAVKFRLQGCYGFWFGPDWQWNCADFIFVCFALADSVMTVMSSDEDSNLQLFTMLRLVRLARVTRLVRLLQFRVFKELVLMIKGVIGGLRTLFWAIVLLAFVIYCLALILRQTIGKWCDPEIAGQFSSLCEHPTLQAYGAQLFSSVLRAAFTVFRCFTEGCAAPDGTPLMVHIFDNSWFGKLFVMIYMLSFLLVTFGLFNLIMAVFVENTMESAKMDEKKRQRLKRNEHVMVARKLQEVVHKFCQRGEESSVKNGHSQRSHGRFRVFQNWMRGNANDEDAQANASNHDLAVVIDRESFGKVLADPYVEGLLHDLEVSVSDHMSLYDALDADGSGSLDVAELVKGLMRLRGTAEKADVVAALLSVRSLQKHVRGFDARMERLGRRLGEGQRRLEDAVVDIRRRIF
eukprot:TRINITY_DN248_c0_g1_i2.p1 TRINITY_DN248_c0_g1~~TRINITY_DN248_c0_g1_i2.p1  ORF type:complete len:761 (-),score=153.61 TRINITY_DN248_c0_g1_i2:1491-3773(-)